MIGTWTLNLARSTSSRNPRPPAPLSDVRRFSTIEGGRNLMVRSGVNAVGQPTFGIVTFKFDGKQYPVYSQDTLASFLATGKPTNVMWSFLRIDLYTTQVTTYIDGKAIAPFVFAVSKDGTILTQAPKEAEPKDVLVFDRVR